MTTKCAALVVLLFSVGLPRHVAGGAETGGVLVFRDARVFDGAQVLPRATVLVRNGRIAAVGPQVQAPDGARIIDARGKTLLLGLIDSHTHVFGPEVLRAALVFGVTTEFDMFMSDAVLADIRKELAGEEGPDMADLRSAGILVTAPGGHGTEYGLPIPTLSSPEQEEQRAEANRPTSVPSGAKVGLVSDFEDGKASARFGAGWQVSTDSLRGGKSKASFKVVENGAQKSKGALLVEGEVDAGLPYAWAGAIFFPGEVPMSLADLSSKKQVSFWAKADGRIYSVMLFAPSRNFAPIIQTFVPERGVEAIHFQTGAV